jgi:Asp-tRNA(Asn)/Glu-tRNA(Gln) amidotransferase A subunit family amidase
MRCPLARVGRLVHVSVEGPMVRSVRDVAPIVGAISGLDPHSLVAIAENVFLNPLQRDFPGVRVARSRNLGVLCPRTRA